MSLPSFLFEVIGLAARHRSEQNRTLSQSRAHFLRQAKGRPQEAQVFVGRSDLRRIFAMRISEIERELCSCHRAARLRIAVVRAFAGGMALDNAGFFVREPGIGPARRE